MKDEAESKSPHLRRPGNPGATTAASANSSRPAATPMMEKQALAQISLVVQTLIACELKTADLSDSAGRAAFRVCGKLRGPLSSLIGAAGFRSLFSRALALAKGKVPWLGGFEVGPDGNLGFSAETDHQLDGIDAAQGGTALIEQLLGLLVTFIGEALTLRLVQNVWPKAALIESGSKENSHEKIS